MAMVCERSDPAEDAAPHQPSSYTYAELLGEVNRVANALRSLGVKKGDVVSSATGSQLPAATSSRWLFDLP